MPSALGSRKLLGKPYGTVLDHVLAVVHETEDGPVFVGTVGVVHRPPMQPSLLLLWRPSALSVLTRLVLQLKILKIKSKLCLVSIYFL